MRNNAVQVSFLVWARTKDRTATWNVSGALGGYVLTRKASAMTVLDVVGSVQGEASDTLCMNTDGPGKCPMNANRDLERLWIGLSGIQREALRSVTYEDMAQQQNKAGRGNYMI
ncbi:MAG TPA: Rrf2 family transcriptional regulator [Candidatus Brocadiia bacterium]|nr:Rrf2 family transcriptional regulator [Candidatus Brocadiia bacterium]